MRDRFSAAQGFDEMGAFSWPPTLLCLQRDAAVSMSSFAVATILAVLHMHCALNSRPCCILSVPLADVIPPSEPTFQSLLLPGLTDALALRCLRPIAVWYGRKDACISYPHIGHGTVASTLCLRAFFVARNRPVVRLV